MFTKVIWAVFLGAGVLVAGQAHAAGPTTSTHYVTILPAPGEECSSPGDLCRDGSYLAGTLFGRTLYITNPTFEVRRRWDSENCYRCGDGSVLSGYDPTSGYINTYEAMWNWVKPGVKTEVGLEGYFDAAAYCASLVAHGKSDWFLPSHAEFVTIASASNTACNNGNCGMNIIRTEFYHTSTENSATTARSYRPVDGNNWSAASGAKSASYLVRCARQELP